MRAVRPTSTSFHRPVRAQMVTENDIVGYTVAYDRDDIQFPVYIVTLFAIGLGAAAMTTGLPVLAVLAVVPAAYAYYNLPLIETGRPRLGSGQYGLFIEGLGLVSWRAVERIDAVGNDLRGVTWHELHIAVKQPLNEALLVDWRQRTLARRFMRLPWSVGKDGVIRVPLDILDRPPEEIHANLLRTWKYNRGA